MDPLFQVVPLNRTTNPNRSVWYAMHQDYSEEFVCYESIPSERKAGEICIKRLLGGERGHYGPFEHAFITLNAGFFPHSVMQQLRTHRVGVSFDVQSMRYTGDRIVRLANSEAKVEEVFYLRPVGRYPDRDGGAFEYTKEARDAHLLQCVEAAKNYASSVASGMPYEQARGLLPFDFRQHFVVSFNARSLMHVLDLRSKLDAQHEVRQFCELVMPHFCDWMPELHNWYQASRKGKARLAP